LDQRRSVCCPTSRRIIDSCEFLQFINKPMPISSTGASSGYCF
jgi:hypothetical protein